MLGERTRVLWNDGPRLRNIAAKLEEENLAPVDPGKGRNVWYCFGYALASDQCQSVALHDCDITTYDRSLLARLLYPVANPNFNYVFCKGFYARVADNKMHGRVSRLLVTPLIRALKKVVGSSDYLDYMDSFRYPLAGEFSFRMPVINDLKIPSDWGFANNRICQADIAEVYDHKHQDLSPDDAAQGLSKMSIDICKALYRKLATKGVVFHANEFRTIKATYLRIALDFVETYANDAQMNGISVDIHSEEAAVELFAKNLLLAADEFLENPMEQPFVPSWNRVISAFDDIQQELLESVEADMQEFGS